MAQYLLPGFGILEDPADGKSYLIPDAGIWSSVATGSGSFSELSVEGQSVVSFTGKATVRASFAIAGGSEASHITKQQIKAVFNISANAEASFVDASIYPVQFHISGSGTSSFLGRSKNKTSFAFSGDALAHFRLRISANFSGTSSAAFTGKFLPQFCPTYVLPGYVFDGTNLNIPVSILPGVSAAEANATTGDWREIVQGLLICLHDYLSNKEARFFNISTADIFRLDNWNAKSSILGYGNRRRFRVSFNIDFPTPDLTEE